MLDFMTAAREPIDGSTDPMAPYFQFGTENAPKHELPKFGHNHQSEGRGVGALFRQGYELNIVTPKDIVIVFMNGFEASEAINGDKRRYGWALPGDMRWHPAGTLLQVRTEGVTAELAGISFDPDLRRDVCDQMRLSAERRRVLDEYTLRNGSIYVMRMAQRIRQAAMTGRPLQRMAVDALCIDALRAGVSFITSQDADVGKSVRLSRTQLTRVADFIDAHLTDDITMKDVAAQCDFTQPYFTTAFKASTGLTPYQYLLERRMARTREMLLTSDLTTAAIAYECGYSSQAHMTDLFKKKMGVTPVKFRKSYGRTVHAMKNLH